MSRRLFITSSPNENLALTNKIYSSIDCFPPNVKYVIININPNLHKQPNDILIFNLESHSDIKNNQIAFNIEHRKWLKIALKDEIEIIPYYPTNLEDITMTELHIDIQLLKKQQIPDQQIKCNLANIIDQFITKFTNNIFMLNQPILFEYINTHDEQHQIILFNITITKIINLGYYSYGILHPNTYIKLNNIENENKLYILSNNITNSNPKKYEQTRKTIINPDWNFEKMGVGGLDNEFSTMFRRAFASRIMPNEIVEKLGIKHVKGMILYGPPGTGKTLMARQIGKMLNGCEPKIVNGPEILNKYVGESEANIRQLFEDAEQEYKLKGDFSRLHIIIFDEIDSICKSRGTVQNSGVADSIVNQLLSKIDGINSLNNILLIGMTNRIDMLDEALLRAGRLELHIQIGLPDEQGRYQIFLIHTKKMRENNYLDQDVDLYQLAKSTKNFTGAEIEGLIRSAISFATQRCIKTSNVDLDMNNITNSLTDIQNLKITNQDFNLALTEIIPSNGISIQNIPNNLTILHGLSENILSKGQEISTLLRTSNKTTLISLLLYGDISTGKTALAAKIALNSEFPCVKYISAEQMILYNEQARCNEIIKIFNSAYISPLSIVIIDDIERLIDYVSVGMRFSNMILQCLLVHIKKQPPNGHKIFIICTSKYDKNSILNDLSIIDNITLFEQIDKINNLEQLIYILEQLKCFNDNEIQILNNICNSIHNSIHIGIKKLYMIIEMCMQYPEIIRINEFIKLL